MNVSIKASVVSKIRTELLTAKRMAGLALRLPAFVALGALPLIDDKAKGFSKSIVAEIILEEGLHVRPTNSLSRACHGYRMEAYDDGYQLDSTFQNISIKSKEVNTKITKNILEVATAKGDKIKISFFGNNKSAVEAACSDLVRNLENWKIARIVEISETKTD